MVNLFDTPAEATFIQTYTPMNFEGYKDFVKYAKDDFDKNMEAIANAASMEGLGSLSESLNKLYDETIINPINQLAASADPTDPLTRAKINQAISREKSSFAKLARQHRDYYNSTMSKAPETALDSRYIQHQIDKSTFDPRNPQQLQNVHDLSEYDSTVLNLVGNIGSQGGAARLGNGSIDWDRVSYDELYRYADSAAQSGAANDLYRTKYSQANFLLEQDGYSGTSLDNMISRDSDGNIIGYNTIKANVTRDRRGRVIKEDYEWVPIEGEINEETLFREFKKNENFLMSSKQRTSKASVSAGRSGGRGEDPSDKNHPRTWFEGLTGNTNSGAYGAYPGATSMNDMGYQVVTNEGFATADDVATGRAKASALKTSGIVIEDDENGNPSVSITTTHYPTAQNAIAATIKSRLVFSSISSDNGNLLMANIFEKEDTNFRQSVAFGSNNNEYDSEEDASNNGKKTASGSIKNTTYKPSQNLYNINSPIVAISIPINDGTSMSKAMAEEVGLFDLETGEYSYPNKYKDPYFGANVLIDGMVMHFASTGEGVGTISNPGNIGYNAFNEDQSIEINVSLSKEDIELVNKYLTYKPGTDEAHPSDPGYKRFMLDHAKDPEVLKRLNGTFTFNNREDSSVREAGFTHFALNRSRDNRLTIKASLHNLQNCTDAIRQVNNKVAKGGASKIRTGFEPFQ